MQYVRKRTSHRKIMSPPFTRIEVDSVPILMKLKSGGEGKWSLLMKPVIREPPKRVKFMPMTDIDLRKFVRQVG